MEQKEMTLLDTAEMMGSADYKQRFKSEYYQLMIRRDKLRAMLDKYRDGKLDFTPSCSYDLLHEQLVYMDGYMKVLKERAEIEKVFEDINAEG